MALTAKLHDTAPAQRKTGTSPGWLSVDSLYLSSAHGSFMYAVNGLCTTFILRRLSTVLRFQHGAPEKVCTVAGTPHLSVPKPAEGIEQRRTLQARSTPAALSRSRI